MRGTTSVDPAGCADLLRRARRVVALTGAGISTSAGVPDFRGPQGLYVTRRYDPEKVFTISGFMSEPVYFYEFSRDFIATLRQVKPTPAHDFLVQLEQTGTLAGIVTQNIDLLHQLAGSKRVVELHGSYRSAICLACGRRFLGLTLAWWDEAMHQSATPPVARCTDCGGVLKPEIVFFGEPVLSYQEAEDLVAGCDLLLVLGSSLQVTPASLLPLASSAPCLIVNRGEIVRPTAECRFVDAELDAYFMEVARHLATG